MRVLPSIRIRKIKSILKGIFCTVLSAAVSVGVFGIFGKQIAGSAYDYTFGEIEVDVSDFRPGSDEKAAGSVVSSDRQELIDQVLSVISDGGDSGQLEASQLGNVTTDTPQVTDNPDAIVVNLSALSGKYKDYGGTSLINNTDYDVTSLLYADYTPPQPNKEDPYILIYHTHTSEEYYGGGTVVDVGNAMAQEFERLGYKTIHLTEVYDKEQFSGAYSRSIVGVQEMLEKYPSIQLCFDVHRDAITTQSGDSYRPLTQIDGKNTAQVMLVCGTDAKGLSHPNWRENFKFALDISRTMGQNYGALSRPVNLRGDRFNTHVTNYTVLMEVGSVANTLEEAQNAALYTARAVIDTIE